MTDLLRQSSDEDGMSLIEMLVAMVVLAVALMALAQVMIGSLRTTREAQTTQVVTAASMEAIERLLALDWHEAALYGDDVAAADARWGDRLDASGDFEGLELVTLDGPTTEDARNAEVPRPSWTDTYDGTEYTFDLYAVWVDRSATSDGTADTKRFVVIATWDDPIRGPQELRSAAERAPTQGEAGSNASGGRFILKYASPNPVDVDPETGQRDGFVDFRARTNVGLQGAVTAEMRWPEPIIADDGSVSHYQEAVQPIQLSGVATGDDGGWITFEGTFNGHRGNDSDNGKYRFPNGPVEVSLSGTTLVGDEAVNTELTLTVRNSPYDGPTGPVEEPTEDPTDDGDPVYADGPAVSNVSVSSICASNSDWTLASPITVSFTVKNVEPPSGTEGTSTYVPPDAAVTVSFPHWSTKHGDLQDPDAAGSVSASYQSGTTSSSTWTASVPVDPEVLFRPGHSIDFTVDVTRSSDGANDTQTKANVAITKSSQC